MGKPRVDLSGNVFGKWTAQCYDGLSMWVCLCECGHEGLVKSYDLCNGTSTQCWECGNKHAGIKRALPEGEAAFNQVYTQYVDNARNRNIVWDLDKSLARFFFGLPCVYCNSFPSNVYSPVRAKGSFIYNGIDRVSSSLGYVSTNCAPCCKLCNRMKMALSQEEFVDHVHKISTVMKELPLCL
jgi:hypothetical protein